MISVTDEDNLSNSIKLLYPRAKNIKIVNSWKDESVLRVICEIKKLTIEFEEDYSKRQMHLFLKTPTSGDTFQIFSKYQIYEREQHTFEILIPQLKKYIDSDIFPIHYFTTNTGTLVLEDLSVLGYKCADRGEFWNLNQCRQSLKALAEFHAASHKLFQQNSNVNADVFSYDHILKSLEGLIEAWNPVISELLKLNKEDLVLKKFTKTISFYRKNVSEMIYNNFKFLVLNHGDYRTENILCKYNDRGEVSDVKIVDFHTSNWSSPVFDFMYFLLLSIEFDVVENHFKELIEWYLQHLNLRLKKIGLTNTYNQTNFMNDLKYTDRIYFFNILLFCSIIGPYKNREIEDSLLKSTNTALQPSYINLLNDEQFSKKVMNWLKFYKKIYL